MVGEKAANSQTSADELFRKGEFHQARLLYAAMLEQQPVSPTALTSLGHLALLSNRLDEARRTLLEAVGMKCDSRTHLFLAETFYCLDEFVEAAPLFQAGGKTSKTRKLESFRGTKPYGIGGTWSGRAEFLQTDPLPLVQATVNTGHPGCFLIDTGGSELILDTDFARQATTIEFGPEEGTFAGGESASYIHGRIDSFEIGGLTVKDLPVHLMDTRRFSAVAPGRTVSGIIGTAFLYHFLPTIDYLGGVLVLNRRESSSELETESGGSIQVPFWLAGDHFIVARGTVNNGPPCLLLVDTGLAGLGFTCPKSTLEESGIAVQADSATEGLGGGGKVKVSPITVQKLTLGGAAVEDVTGVYGAFPPQLESGLGFRIGGLVSHGFFRNMKVSFDFQKMRIRMKGPR